MSVVFSEETSVISFAPSELPVPYGHSALRTNE